jgi:hypothetical protein
MGRTPAVQLCRDPKLRFDVDLSLPVALPAFVRIEPVLYILDQASVE